MNLICFSYNEFKANAVRPMPKPAPVTVPNNYTQAQPQARPAPFVTSPPAAPAQPKPSGGMHWNNNNNNLRGRENFLF